MPEIFAEHTIMIQNAIYLPKLDKYYVSSHRHDYVQFTLDGSDPVTSPVPSSTFFIDGGRDYRRSNFISHPEIIDFTLADDASDDEIYNKLLWGNKGKLIIYKLFLPPNIKLIQL